MLSSPSIIETVADRIEAWGIEHLVVDPVMVAKSGDRLLQFDAIETLKLRLLPLAKIVTPNIAEAEAIAGRSIQTDDDAKYAAAAIGDLGPSYVVLKGGHREGAPVDLIFDGRLFIELSADRVATANTHGTGCTFSAAIAAYLARGLEPMEAIREAKSFITNALRASYRIGAGHSPVNHFFGVEISAAPDFASERG
jgi:hydroxymethylpyrimidine/phosphomethylpyrimidine kinase